VRVGEGYFLRRGAVGYDEVRMAYNVIGFSPPGKVPEQIVPQDKP
jgi:hypothetical protein